MGNKLLIVDGEKILSEYLNMYFKNLNFNVSSVNNYEYAKILLQMYQFDFVIVDFFIGGECAESLCEWLINQKGDSTNLIITNRSQTSEDELRIRKLSPLFYFIKPYIADDLRSVIEKAVRWKNPVRPVHGECFYESISTCSITGRYMNSLEKWYSCN